MSIFVIAEAGVNHGGSFADALKLVDAAKSTGASAVKFQHFRAAALQPERYDLLKPLELSNEQMRDVAAYCKAVGIEFMCTPFGVEEVHFLAPLVRRMKVASGCIGKRALLEAVAATRLPAIVSTGMAEREDIDGIMAVFGWGHSGTQHTLLHCTSAYPCAIEDVNLRAMASLGKYTGWPVGYSDHTQGITVAIAAAATGATVIEKHLTLDRNAVGPDHKTSLEPSEFRVMVTAIRTVEAAMGDGVKRVRESELALRKVWHG